MSSLHGGPPSRWDREASLLKKWKEIEALDEDEDNVTEQEFTRCKEAWFVQAFSFLQDLPLEEHCWCKHSEIAWPLLEPFYCYYTVSESNSSVKILWKRFSQEFRKCTECVLQYYKAKEMYATEFLEDVVSDLLAVLRTLDEERVATHLHEILCKMKSNSLNSDELICVLFEVMRFPALLDDAEVDTAFVEFLQFVENTFDLTLAADQCYAGIYALFFHNDQATRRVALRLAGTFGKLRTAADLEPIQPLLQKHMHCLEFDLFDQKRLLSGKWSSDVNSKSTQKSSSPSAVRNRPRACSTRESLWMGLKTLLGMLEPPAFEEGVVERYPIFLSIVLNHASESTPVFWNALHCLKLLLEVLGYKLWIKTTFSPGVMRSTLIGQCFHTREEKMHKAIFDLFQPFLQSLEALQDGEYERQRRNILYFLLQQVGHSRNFSGLMSKKARQIAFLIVMRGFKLDPACPPMECVHVWGPLLLESVRDTQLYDSLRQPAVQLLETIIIADSVVLTFLHSRGFESKTSCSHDLPEVVEDAFDDSHQLFETEKEISYIREYKALEKLGDSWNTWLCAPILWVEILGKGLPSDLPDSFSQAIVWASSRLCTVFLMDQLASSDVQPGEYPEVVSSKSISSSLVWETPKGCDDGADGKLCPNTLKAWCHGSELVSLLKRCVGTFMGQIQLTRVTQNWIWDPYLAEVLVLLSLDSYDRIKDFGRYVLSHFANDSSLDNGVIFLCSSGVSASCVISGLLYATKLLMMNRLHETIFCLQNLLFLYWKLINLWQRPSLKSSESPGAISITSKEGGFLKQPNYEQPLGSGSSSVYKESNLEKEKNLQQLSSFLWPLLLKLMKDGRPYSEDSAYLMVFTRTFDLLPLAFKNILSSLSNGFLQCFPKDFEESHAGNRRSWIVHFLSWGEVCVSSIHRRWKFAVASIVIHLRNMQCLEESIALKETEDWLETGAVMNVQIRDKLEMLLRLALLGASNNVMSRESSLMKVLPHRDVSGMARGITMASSEGQNVIILSDDEAEHPHNDSTVHTPTMERKLMNTVVADSSINIATSDRNLPGIEASISQPRKHMHPISMQKQLGVFPSGHGKKATLDKFFVPAKDKPVQSSQVEKKPMPSVCNADVLECSSKVSSVKRDISVLGSEKRIVQSKGSGVVQKMAEESSNLSTSGTDVEKTEEDGLDAVLKDLVQGESKVINRPNVNIVKSLNTVPKKGLSLVSNPQPKRQLIQLHVPNEHLRGNMKRPGVAGRPPIPRLDEWYKRILSLDYFSVVGLTSDPGAEGIQAEPMLKVPLSFRSSQHYMDVFRPLVLEEFRAQLQQSNDQLNFSDETTGILRLMSLEKVDDFDIGRFTPEAGADGPARACFENDLLLLSRQPLQAGAQAVHIIGKVERQERDNKSHTIKLVLKFYLRSGNKRLAKAHSLLMERSKWHVTRLMSITPQLREFQALSAVEYLPLLPVILNDGSCNKGSINIPNFSNQSLQGLSHKLQHRLRAEYNASQLQSVDMALRSAVMANGHELSLVQGPPGTGKTRTILAIVSALIASSKNSSGCTGSAEFSNPLGAVHVNANRSVSKSVAIARSWQAAALAKEQIQLEESENMQKERDKRTRILVCAQSNAAVDELVSRMCKDGLYNSDGGFFRPFLVRVGNAKSVHPNCLPVFIDTLVENQMQSNKENRNSGAAASTGKNTAELLRGKLDKILDSIQVLEAQLSKLQNNDANSKKGIAQATMPGTADLEGTIKMELNMLYKERRQICRELAVLEAGEKESWEEARTKRLLLKRDIIRRAEVVVATLSGCGGDVYSACVDKGSKRRQIRNLDDGLFDAVVIDEAAQALEPATLIPLQLLKASHAKCIMVGDPKQLPATVISQTASRFSFECSLFERLQRGGLPVSLLTVQYRMHPQIREFPSAHFYDNQLQDGDALLDGRIAEFHKNNYSGPYAVFDVVEGFEKVQHQAMSQSLCNEAEVDMALEIYRNLMRRYPNEIYPGRIGIITPYQQQLSLLREQFRRILGQSVAGVEFNTVDGFQGREVDILIFSTVRAASRNTQSSSRIGFVADVRRMNVALTRARFSLWIVCNAATLQASPPWAALLQNAMERGVLHTVKSPYRGFFDNCRSVEPREKIECNPRRPSPPVPCHTISQLEIVTEKNDTGKPSTAHKSNSPYRSPKTSDIAEKSSHKIVMSASMGDHRNDSEGRLEFEGDRKSNHSHIKCRESKVDGSFAKDIRRNENSLMDKSRHDISQSGRYKASRDKSQAVSSDKVPDKPDKNSPRLGSSDAGKLTERMSVKSKDYRVSNRSLEPGNCKESGVAPEVYRLPGPKGSTTGDKKQTGAGTQFSAKGLDRHMAGATDSQIQTTEDVDHVQTVGGVTMYKDMGSRKSSISRSKDRGRVFDKAELKRSPILETNSTNLGTSQPFASEVRSKSIRCAGEGVISDKIKSNSSEAYTEAKGTEGELKISRPPKRRRHEKAAGSGLLRDLQQNMQAKSSMCIENHQDDLHVSRSSEEYLNKEWDRFLRVLNESKIVFPLRETTWSSSPLDHHHNV